MDLLVALDEGDTPIHLQQLQHISAALRRFKQQSDSVTWVPDTVPRFVQEAVCQGMSSVQGAETGELQAGTNIQDVAEAADFFSGPDSNPAHRRSPYSATNAHHPTSAAAPIISSAVPTDSLNQPPTGHLSESQQQAAEPADPAAGPAVVIGNQHWRSGGSSKRVDWVVTTCLVPDGMPTAAASEAGGGLAALEVVCRVLVLQDCQPAAASPGLEQALKKVKWQEFGLTFKEFYNSTATDDPTGLLTLGVLPEAVVTPLALIVCSCIPIVPSEGLQGPDATTQTQQDIAVTARFDPDITHATPQPSQTAPQDTAEGSSSNQQPRKRKRAESEHPNPGRKRHRGLNPAGSSPKTLTLSAKREKDMYISAFEAALVQLKQKLPTGYLQGKLEALVTACLPSISTSLASILMRVSDPRIRDDACDQLACQPLELQQQLLANLQAAAAAAIAAKSQLAANRKQQQRQGQDQSRKSRGAADAAAVAASAGDGIEQDPPAEEQQPVEQQQQEWQQHQQESGDHWFGLSERGGQQGRATANEECLQQQRMQGVHWQQQEYKQQLGTGVGLWEVEEQLPPPPEQREPYLQHWQQHQWLGPQDATLNSQQWRQQAQDMPYAHWQQQHSSVGGLGKAAEDKSATYVGGLWDEDIIPFTHQLQQQQKQQQQLLGQQGEAVDRQQLQQQAQDMLPGKWQQHHQQQQGHVWLEATEQYACHDQHQSVNVMSATANHMEQAATENRTQAEAFMNAVTAAAAFVEVEQQGWLEEEQPLQQQQPQHSWQSDAANEGYVHRLPGVNEELAVAATACLAGADSARTSVPVASGMWMSRKRKRLSGSAAAYLF